MGESIRARKGKLAGRSEQDARLGCVVQVKRGAEEIGSFELSGKEFFFMMKRNRERGKGKNNGSKQNEHRRQSVRNRSWWEQGNIKMAVSEDHAS